MEGGEGKRERGKGREGVRERGKGREGKGERGRERVISQHTALYGYKNLTKSRERTGNRI